MNWIILSLLGPFFWACSNFVDKYLLGKYTKGIYDFLFFSAISNWVFFIILFSLVGWPELNFYTLIPISTGIILIYSYGFYGKALEKGDTSTLVILFLLIPVFTLILGYLFLGQVISLVELLGSLIVLLGAFIISFEKSQRFFAREGIGHIMIAVLIWSAMFLLIDYGLTKISFWEYFMLDNLGSALAGLSLFILPKMRREVVGSLKTSSIRKYILFSFNNLLDFLGQMSVKMALVTATSVGLVTVLNQVQSFYAIIIGIVLTILMPTVIKEDVRAVALLRKFGGAVVMFVGVYILFI